MIGAPDPGVVNALQVTIPGRSPSVPSVKALGNARDEKKSLKALLPVLVKKTSMIRFITVRKLLCQRFAILLLNQ